MNDFIYVGLVELRGTRVKVRVTKILLTVEFKPTTLKFERRAIIQ